MGGVNDLYCNQPAGGDILADVIKLIMEPLTLMDYKYGGRCEVQRQRVVGLQTLCPVMSRRDLRHLVSILLCIKGSHTNAGCHLQACVPSLATATATAPPRVSERAEGPSETR